MTSWAAAPTPAQTSKPPKPLLCTYCGTDDDNNFAVISRHRTSNGTTVWLRCSCGALQARAISRAGSQIVASGHR
ncbi:hypothetical protein ACL02U_32575 [Streptomyces sp. MS06]|uniref:hypothetical protein n=1 Tax=Streptomyces sp. MS06 TaxID=3385974 RepID=UPI0039A388D8